MAQHHRCAQDESGRIRFVLARDVRRRTVYCFEDRHVVADVCRRCETESAGEAGSEIAEDVAVHVRRHDDVELLGPHGELVGGVVDQDVLRCN